MAHRASDERDGHSSATPVARRLKQPTRTATRKRLELALRAVPIRSCSRWGLPCRFRCRKRGALLPHRFTLASAIRYAPRRSVLCGTVPELAPAGSYPAPFIRGARTFLPGHLSVIAGAAVQPTDGRRCGAPRCLRQGSTRPRLRLCRLFSPEGYRLAFAWAAAGFTGSLRASSSLRSVSRVDVSAMPSICAGRKRRWKAVTTTLVVSS